MKSAILFLLFVFFAPHSELAHVEAAEVRASVHAGLSSEKFVRTELYFGLTKPDGTTLTDVEWASFVDEVITPRFPDGFTVVDGKGQWRNKEGKIAGENSKVFIVVYPRKESRAAGVKVDEIRAEYKKRFDQESVLRVDLTKSVEVSF